MLKQLAFAALSLLASTVTAQQIGLRIDFTPPTGADANDPLLGNWYTLPDVPLAASNLRIRMRTFAPEGTWTRPLINYEIGANLRSNPPQWLLDNDWLLTDPEQVPTLAGLAADMEPFLGSAPLIHIDSQNVAVPKPDGLLRWMRFMTTDGTPNVGPTGCVAWSQPIHSPGSGTIGDRLWTTDPAIWNTGNGVASQFIWNTMRVKEASGTSTFSFFAMLRWALIEQSIFETGSEIAAGHLLNSLDWNRVLDSQDFKLSIQVLGLQPTIIDPGLMDDDEDVPALFTDSSLPLTFVSPAHAFKITPPQPLPGNMSETFQDFGDAALVPGTFHRFHSDTARYPIWCKFPVMRDGVAQFVEVQAKAVAFAYDPTVHIVMVPEDLMSGIVCMKHGEMLDYVAIGPATTGN